MQLLIQWPYSLYDEGYCAVIVSCDGDMTTLLEQAVYAVARHRSSQFCTLTGARPPHPIVQEVNGPGATGRLCTLGDFALYKDGMELPRTGTLAEAGIADRDWLMLDYVVRDRFGNGQPAKEVRFDSTTASVSENVAIAEAILKAQGGGSFNVAPAGKSPREYPFPIVGAPSVMPTSLDALCALIREEIAAHERRKWERDRYRARRAGHSHDASSES